MRLEIVAIAIGGCTGLGAAAGCVSHIPDYCSAGTPECAPLSEAGSDADLTGDATAKRDAIEAGMSGAAEGSTADAVAMDTGGPETGVPEGGGAGCDGAASIVCAGQCVDSASDPSHCGSCTKACAAPRSTHGSATCERGGDGGAACAIACASGYHACQGDCLADSDVPSTTADPCVVADRFGVFVAPPASGGSDTAGTGTMAAPFGTIGHALSTLGGKARVYACNGTYSESATVSISSAVGIYGGLACPGTSSAWSYVGGQAKVTGPPNQAAAVINASGSAVDVEDMAFSAPNASGRDSAGNGDSSVAVLVNASSSVAFHRCALTAGSGDNGNDGTAGRGNYTGATAQDGSANTGATGGQAGQARCGNGTSSTGGKGGDGSVPSGASGGDGASSPAATLNPPFDGKGGGGGGVGCGSTANPGANGAARSAGGAATVYGLLSANGWTPSAGGDGSAGNPGQGGGGGGGKGIPVATGGTGGTGGGAGGCGGAGGSGGKSGGASIALASVQSIVALDACTLTTAAGGKGGKGGDGEPGQGGGFTSASTACAGNYGGNGAGGSGGAGGTGGISVCVVYSGAGPQGSPGCMMGSAGVAGAGGGSGAAGSNALGTGAAGSAGTTGLAGVSQAQLQTQ